MLLRKNANAWARAGDWRELTDVLTPNCPHNWDGAIDKTFRKERMKIMKIIVTSKGKTLDDAVDPRFGRASYFIVVDSETSDFEAHDNSQNMNASQGAGVQAAQNVVGLGAEVVISGHFGPKAFQVLSTAGVKMFNTNAKTVGEAVDQYRAGSLIEAKSADVEGHW